MAKMGVFCIWRISRYMGNCCPGKKPNFQDHRKWLFSGPQNRVFWGPPKKAVFSGPPKKAVF